MICHLKGNFFLCVPAGAHLRAPMTRKIVRSRDALYTESLAASAAAILDPRALLFSACRRQPRDKRQGLWGQEWCSSYLFLPILPFGVVVCTQLHFIPTTFLRTAVLCLSLRLILPFCVRVFKEFLALRTFALIVSAHPYCARKFTCHVTPRARVLSTKMNNDRADGHCQSFDWI